MTTGEELTETKETPVRRRRGPSLFSLGFPLVLFLTIGTVIFVATLLTIRPVGLPDWAAERLEAQVNQRLGPNLTLGVGSVQVSMLNGVEPTVHLNNVALSDPKTGRELTRLQEVSAAFSVGSLLSGSADAEELAIRGAELTLRRNREGRFEVSFGKGLAGQGDLTQILDQIDRAFAMRPLSKIRRIEVSDVTITIEDERAQRIWQVTGGRIDLVQDATSVNAGVSFEIFDGTETLAPVQIALKINKGSSAAEMVATFRNALAPDIALQSPGLAFLALLDSRLSGEISLALDDKGELSGFEGTLDVGAGRFSRTTGGEDVQVESGHVDFAYLTEQHRLRFDTLSLVTDKIDVALQGHALLTDLNDQGRPGSLIGQFDLIAGRFTDPALLPAPVVLTQGHSDFRLTFAPFGVEIGQLALSDGESTLNARGSLQAPRETQPNWAFDLRADLDAITAPRLLAYWPETLIERPRKWLSDNIQEGNLRDVHARLASSGNGEVMDRYLSWNFDQVKTTFMKTLPPAEDGSGYGSLDQNRLSLTAEGGHVASMPYGEVLFAGSTLVIEDVRDKPATGLFDLSLRGPAPVYLSLLANKPFLVLEKLGRKADFATGEVIARASVALPLKKGVLPDEVKWEAFARVLAAETRDIVPTGVLRGEDLSLHVTPDEITIAGPMQLDEITFEASFHQWLGKKADGRSQVSGVATLDQAFLDEFSIALPKGSVSGSGRGTFTLDLPKGQPISFTLDSDLAGLAMKIPSLGWSKGQKTLGKLRVEGRLAGLPEISLLELDAAGLKATGSLSVAPDGGLKTAEFSKVVLAGWLDAPVTLTGRGINASPGVSVTGGTVDFRKANFGSGATTGGGPVTLALDKLIVADSIVLNRFRGDFTTNGGFAGSFVARLNGGGEILGEVTRTDLGAALRVTSDNAGEVFKDAGIAERVRGGTLVLTLTPTGEEGTYAGQAHSDRVSVRGTPALAELLSAISVVGLLEQLNGEGISFDQLDAKFTLTPTYIQFHKASAVGAAMGIALEGAYTLGSGALNFRGTISPIYFVNGIGQIFSRKGGGLFGFDFKLKGTSEAPKVQVNPLSILTPGMFKELFRSDPPKPVQ